MFLEFDQSTLAYMTAALEQVCKKIPPEIDSNELRKRIADEMIASAKAYRRTYADFEEAGLKVLGDVRQPGQFDWLLQKLSLSS
jgi:hypothetical protein